LPRFDYDTKQLLNIYYETFGGAILEAFDLLTEMGLYNKDKKKKLFVDCSNGVGGMHQERLTQEYLHKIFDVVNINTKDTLYLNEDCGSEFVQKEKKLPRGLLDYINKNINESEDLDKMSFLSYDGDADRTVYL
jgi:phosphomannomutase